MINLHTLIVGRTGSGKTVLVKRLVDLTARGVVFDRKMEYNPSRGIMCYTLREAVTAFQERRWRPFIIVCRFRDPEDYFRMLEIGAAYQEAEPHGPLVVFMEEFSQYSETHEIPGIVRDLYNQGRHLRFSLCAVIQKDTDVHRVTRSNSEIIVSCAQNTLSADMKQYFTWQEISALTSVRHDFENGRPVIEPEQGRHFITNPRDIDLYETWINVHGIIYQPTGKGTVQ